MTEQIKDIEALKIGSQWNESGLIKTSAEQKREKIISSLLEQIKGLKENLKCCEEQNKLLVDSIYELEEQIKQKDEVIDKQRKVVHASKQIFIQFEAKHLDYVSGSQCGSILEDSINEL